MIIGPGQYSDMTAPVFLEGDGVTLHPVEEGDLPFLQRLVNDPDVRHGMSLAEPRREADERAFRVEGDDDRIHLLVRADGGRVGVVDLIDIDRQFGNAEVGYFFAPETWGNGYATATVEQVVEYAFEELRLHRVNATVFASNEASGRVLEKVGFEREGVHREAAFLHGEYVDAHRYGLLEYEWRDRMAARGAGHGSDA